MAPVGLLRPLARGRRWWRRLHPARRMLVGYLLWAGLGWALLALPWSRTGHVGALDLLFLSVAAISTSGLTALDLPALLTPLGQGVLLLLIQVGGLGYMTLGALAYAAISDRAGPSRGEVVRAAFGLGASADLRLFLRSVWLFTLACEAGGALLLWWAFARAGVEGALWQGVFHAVSAFCTAGVSLLPGGLVPLRADVAVNALVMGLALLGALGFLVVGDLWLVATRRAARLGFSSTVILRILPALVIAGALAIGLCDGTLAALPAGERALVALFHAVSATTTAGFNTVDLGAVAPASALVLLVLMVIGPAPAGTGGGLRVTSFAALGGLVADVIAQRDVVTIFGRRVSDERLRLATATLGAYLGMATLSAFALSLTDAAPLGTTAFEVASLLSNVGLSQGLAAALSPAGQVVAMVTMMAGRLGILTFGLAVAVRGEAEAGVVEELVL